MPLSVTALWLLAGASVLAIAGPVGTAVGQAVAGQFVEHTFLAAVALSRR